MLDHSQCKEEAQKSDSEGGMNNYLRNVAVLRKIQIARDKMEPPEYWERDENDEEGGDEDEN